MRPRLSLMALSGGPGALLLLLAGCGGGSEAPPSGNSCSLSAEVFGGATIQIEANEPTTCTSLNASGSSGISATWIGPESKGTIELDIDNIAEAQVGTAFPTTTIVQDSAGNRWQGNCQSNITEHRLLEAVQSTIGELRHHQLAGTVTCAQPLTPLSASVSETVFVDRLEVRVQVSWRN